MVCHADLALVLNHQNSPTVKVAELCTVIQREGKNQEDLIGSEMDLPAHHPACPSPCNFYFVHNSTTSTVRPRVSSTLKRKFCFRIFKYAQLIKI